MVSLAAESSQACSLTTNQLTANFLTMTYGRTVHAAPAVRNRSSYDPLRRAHVQILSGDVLEAFVREVERRKVPPRRLTLVTPWISYACGVEGPLARLLRHAETNDSSVVLTTRPSTSDGHAAAIEAVMQRSRGSVLFNPRLHAKLYVCQEGGSGGGFAVIGSANMTSASSGLDEVAVLIRPVGRSRIVSHLAGPTATKLGRRSRSPRRVSKSLRTRGV